MRFRNLLFGLITKTLPLTPNDRYFNRPRCLCKLICQLLVQPSVSTPFGGQIVIFTSGHLCHATLNNPPICLSPSPPLPVTPILDSVTLMDGAPQWASNIVARSATASSNTSKTFVLLYSDLFIVWLQSVRHRKKFAN